MQISTVAPPDMCYLLYHTEEEIKGFCFLLVLYIKKKVLTYYSANLFYADITYCSHITSGLANALQCNSFLLLQAFT